MISLDVAATEFYKNKKYFISSEKVSLSSTAMSEYLIKLCKKYPIFSIEDGMSEDDWKGWSYMSKNISRKTLMIGDDLFVTNKKRLLKGIKNMAANSILIKPNQIGTLSETLDAINLAKKTILRLLFLMNQEKPRIVLLQI